MTDQSNPDPSIFELMKERSIHIPKDIYQPKHEANALDAAFLLKYKRGSRGVWQLVQTLVEKDDSVIAMLAMADRYQFRQVTEHVKNNPADCLQDNNTNRHKSSFNEHDPAKVVTSACLAAMREVNAQHAKRERSEEFALNDLISGWHPYIFRGEDHFRITCKKFAACSRLLVGVTTSLFATNRPNGLKLLAEVVLPQRLAEFRRDHPMFEQRYKLCTGVKKYFDQPIAPVEPLTSREAIQVIAQPQQQPHLEQHDSKHLTHRTSKDRGDGEELMEDDDVVEVTSMGQPVTAMDNSESTIVDVEVNEVAARAEKILECVESWVDKPVVEAWQHVFVELVASLRKATRYETLHNEAERLQQLLLFGLSDLTSNLSKQWTDWMASVRSVDVRDLAAGREAYEKKRDEINEFDKAVKAYGRMVAETKALVQQDVKMEH